MKVCVGCGHCLYGADTGARKYLIEEQETRKVQDVVILYLQNNGMQVKKARIDKANSVNESLAYRVNVSDTWGADLYVEIHLNSGGGHGTETFCIGNGNGRKYATQIVNSIAKLGYTNRGVKDGSNLYVVRKTIASAVLVECCFVDSQLDANMWNVQKMGKAIAEGIIGHAINDSNAGKAYKTPHGIEVDENGIPHGTFTNKKYHALETTQLYEDSHFNTKCNAYLSKGEECNCFCFSQGAALVEYYSKGGGFWKCGYVKYDPKNDNVY